MGLVERLAERVIAESTHKTDKIDARILAEFLALDMIPEAYRPTPRGREYRVLVRYRHYVQKRTVSVGNKIRRILANYNADCRDGKRDHSPALTRLSLVGLLREQSPTSFRQAR